MGKEAGNWTTREPDRNCPEGDHPYWLKPLVLDEVSRVFFTSCTVLRWNQSLWGHFSFFSFHGRKGKLTFIQKAMHILLCDAQTFFIVFTNLKHMSTFIVNYNSVEVFFFNHFRILKYLESPNYLLIIYAFRNV